MRTALPSDICHMICERLMHDAIQTIQRAADLYLYGPMPALLPPVPIDYFHSHIELQMRGALHMHIMYGPNV